MKVFIRMVVIVPVKNHDVSGLFVVGNNEHSYVRRLL